MTTFKGLNWLLLGATIVLGGCDSKGDDTGDDYDTTPSANGDEGSGSDDSDDDDGGGSSDASVEIDFLGFEWSGVYMDGEPGEGYIAGELTSSGEDEPVTTSFEAVFMDQDVWSGDNSDPSGVCIVYGEIEETAFDPTGFEGWDGMAYAFDAGVTSWETFGDACAEAAFQVGADDVLAFMPSFTWGIGYGPMNDLAFEESLSSAVGDTYAAEWAGNVSQGWLYTDITGTAEIFTTNYCFTYEVAEDGMVAVDADGMMVPVDGAADEASPVNGMYSCQMFSGFGWG